MRATIDDYLALTKPRIAIMVVITGALGFFMGGQGIHAPWLFACAMVGTALASCGSAVLNHVIERDVDGLMERTRHRPLPTGRIQPASSSVSNVPRLAATPRISSTSGRVIGW